MAGFTVTQTQDDREATSRSGNSAHRSHFHCLATHGNEVAIRIPDFTVLFSHTFIRVCDLALHKMGPGALPRNCTVISTVGTQPTLGTNVKEGGGIMSPNIKRSIG